MYWEELEVYDGNDRFLGCNPILSEEIPFLHCPNRIISAIQLHLKLRIIRTIDKDLACTVIAYVSDNYPNIQVHYHTVR